MLFITILITIITLVVLVTLHELGHFLLAKKFGVKVEEFGIGYPPRLWGKKVGETVYSLNLFPFGAFVKMLGHDGEESKETDPKSFSEKPTWQRALIILGGVISFWVVAVLLLTLMAGIAGVPTAIPDDLSTGFKEAKVQIFMVAAGSPAEKAGIQPGDEIIRITNHELRITNISKVKEVQDFTEKHKGEQISLLLRRGDKETEVSLVPRVSPPAGEGAMGVALMRVANLKTSWYKAPWVGLTITAKQTRAIPEVLFEALKRKLQGEKVVGIQFVGIVGVGQMIGQSLNQGPGYFLMFVSMISVWLALFNIVPIPALDGGWLLFLLIESVRKKPLSKKIEQNTTAIFLILFIVLMFFLTVRDIARLF